MCMDLPKINDRIRQLIDLYANGSVNNFAKNVGLSQQTLNRLFNIDKRTEKYPVATTEIIVAITQMYVDIDAAWLLTGRGTMLNDPSNNSGNIAHIAGGTNNKLRQEINNSTNSGATLDSAALVKVIDQQKELIDSFQKQIIGYQEQITKLIDKLP